jgi:hypothetical protein
MDTCTNTRVQIGHEYFIRVSNWTRVLLQVSNWTRVFNTRVQLDTCIITRVKLLFFAKINIKKKKFGVVLIF